MINWGGFQMTSKIGWCTETINPITGCLNGCDYCYARKMALRLAGRFGYPKDDPFKPTWHPDKLRDITNLAGKRKRVFLDSMGDWFSPGVKYSWIDQVLAAIRHQPLNTFLVLTKRPDRIPGRLHNIEVPSNLWLGVTVTCQDDVKRIDELCLVVPSAHKFISIEPLHGPVKMDLSDIEWIIIGAESGNRKGKVVPEESWIEGIISQCKVPIFMKDNLKPAYSKPLIQNIPGEMK